MVDTSKSTCTLKIYARVPYVDIARELGVIDEEGEYVKFEDEEISLRAEDIIDLEVVGSDAMSLEFEEETRLIRKVMLRNVPIGTYIAWWEGDKMIQGELIRTNFDADEITLGSWTSGKESSHNIRGDMRGLEVRNGPGATFAVQEKDFTRDIGTYFSKRPEEQYILYEAVRTSMRQSIGFVSATLGFAQTVTGGVKPADAAIEKFVDQFAPDDD
ncbi:hypothetical protein FFI16_019330 [Pseudomonas sp. KBS0710]|uniref:hypothetical protein n=1 Tax=Pseudomonas sp. KBS0710 TaxID=1179667 RepID=UPI00110EE30F|nr:hypothetical protein [Pseudomonas sp. KBS0710]TSD78474.1 hypothetical protein FFI16_019330 [Pseudomonas sp. KBS0710]